MREKTVLQGLAYTMGFGVPVSERNGDISSTIRRARLYPTSYIGTCTVCRLYVHVDHFGMADHPWMMWRASRRRSRPRAVSKVKWPKTSAGWAGSCSLSRDTLAATFESGYHTCTNGVHVPTEPYVSRDRVFRFGPFELSEREGELRKSGVRIKLQEQPFRVLVELLANSGRLVSREDLHQKLWPSDTFVDFDVGLNSAIRKLRQALNDDADHPHYIETLAKRGYRFLAPVTEIGAKGAEQNPQPTSDVATASDTSLLTSSASASPVHAGGSSTRRRVWIAAGTVVAAIVAMLVFWLNRPGGLPIVEAVTQLTDDGEPKSYATKIVTDGVRVYFNEGTYGSPRIAQVAVTGGAVAAVPTAVVAPRLLGLAPEGSALLAKSGAFGSVPNPLWQIPLPTGEPRRIGTIDVQDASFFPDGRILFARKGDLYVAEKDGSNPRKLVSVEGVIRQPSISPDGQRLLFTVWSGIPGIPISIVESMADGSSLHAIVNTSDSGRVCCAQWSPDGKYILFQRRHEGRRDLWFLSMRPGVPPTCSPTDSAYQWPAVLHVSGHERGWKTDLRARHQGAR